MTTIEVRTIDPTDEPYPAVITADGTICWEEEGLIAQWRWNGELGKHSSTIRPASLTPESLEQAAKLLKSEIRQRLVEEASKRIIADQQLIALFERTR